MKKILFLIITTICITNLYAQKTKPAAPSTPKPTYPSSKNCFNEYYTVFRDRGANPVPDGLNDVVVSIRKDGNCTCILGKITVKEGKPVNDLMLEREDGTLAQFTFIPHSTYTTQVTNFENGIFNGMSPTYFSSNEESINLFFIKALKQKQGNYKAAPPIN